MPRSLAGYAQGTVSWNTALDAVKTDQERRNRELVRMNTASADPCRACLVFGVSCRGAGKQEFCRSICCHAGHGKLLLLWAGYVSLCTGLLVSVMRQVLPSARNVQQASFHVSAFPRPLVQGPPVAAAVLWPAS